MSAALVERTGRASLVPLPAATAGPPPKPPATIAGMDRFIALAIRLVRIEPDAPTIMPATISAVLSSARPIAAADRPVKALSSEMTTGMSAPPIGSTTVRPRMPAATSSPMISSSLSPPVTMTTAQTSAISRSSALTGCCSLPMVIGRPLISSWSLPNATFEPQKEIEPMIAANRDAIAM